MYAVIFLSVERIALTVDDNFYQKYEYLLHFWDEEKNSCGFSDIGSIKEKLYWKCNEGHEIILSLEEMLVGTCCMECVNKALLNEFNILDSFAEIRTDLIHQWDITRNGDISPFNVSKFSSKMITWICPESYGIWKASIKNRISSTTSSPFMLNKKVKKGYNDLITLRPDLAEQWDYENNEIFPDEVTPGSSKKVSWVCPVTHEKFVDSVKNRARTKRTDSPYVLRKKLLTGYNDIASLYPQCITHWSYNNIVTPDKEIAINLKNKKFLWIDNETGEEFEDTLLSADEKGYRKHPQGFVSLYDANPVIASQLVGDEDPKEIPAGSNKVKTWKCPKTGFTWETTVHNRLKGSEDSPFISGRKVVQGFNDISTTHPEHARFWSKNNTLLPTEVSYASNKKALWICPVSEIEYEQVIAQRTKSDPRSSPISNNQLIIPGYNDIFTIRPDLKEFFSDKNNINPHELSVFSHKVALWVCNKNKAHEFYCRISDFTRGDKRKINCPLCNVNSSQQEKEVYNFIYDSFSYKKLIERDKSLIQPYEIDIYIPDKNIAIEYNGLYWHSESQGKHSLYHYNKWKECKEKGIQLITIWEDEWVYKQDVVKRMITHKLDEFHNDKIYARNTIFQEIDKYLAESFLNLYHIQGFVRCSKYYGLYHNDNLVAVSGWTKNKDILYLDRYATSQLVVGGMGKLLKHGKRYAVEQGCDRIVTFADHCVSNGNLYEKLGFIHDGEIPPDYKYVVKGKRVHKFNYRKKRFREDTDLLYEEGLTEKQLADLNGMERIWDCGKTRYILNL